MLRPLIVIRHVPKIDFMRWHVVGFAFSGFLTILTVVLLLTVGLNYGIDFRGGTLIEARVTTGPADLADMRSKLDSLGLGEISLQQFGGPSDVLIRMAEQPGGDRAQMAAVKKAQDALGPNIEYRRVEVVGPTVGSELIRAGVLATVLALGAIMIYVWFRFEWQFGLGAMVSTFHDVITTVGLFAVLQLEFNLTTLAAILTIAGYSINDTVVIYDRVRESMRRHRSMPFRDLINLALNETLSRTILTVATTTLAVLALLFLGGEVLRGFSIALLWGMFIGTYSSLFIAAPILYYVQPNRRAIAKDAEPATPAPAPPAKRAPSGPRAEAAMELVPQTRAGHQVIERYAASGFRVSGAIYLGPVLVFPDRTEAWAEAAFTATGLAPVLAHGGVELLLLGFGRRIGPVSADLRSALKARGIAVEPMDTGAACRTYNMLAGEGRRVAAALSPPA